MPEVTVGSSAQCDVNIANDYVSRRHCRLIYTDDGVWIEDLGSSNGTYVDGRQIRPETRVQVEPSSKVSLAQEVTLDWSTIRSFRPDRAKGTGKSGAGKKKPRQKTPKPKKKRSRSPKKAKKQSPSKKESEGIGDEVAKAHHKGKSYVGKAFLTMFLYWLGFLPGFIANILYLSQANKSRKIAGEAPSGYGCLVTLLVLHLLAIIAILSFLASIGMSISSLLG